MVAESDTWKNSGLSVSLIQEIRTYAHRYGMKEVVLFGSRARGDYCSTSDIDLAIRGGRTAAFAAAVDQETMTPLFFDFVDMEDHVSNDLLRAIGRDGRRIHVDRYQAFLSQLSVLRKAHALDLTDTFLESGIVNKFALQFELGWKSMRSILLDAGARGAESGSPRDAIRGFHALCTGCDADIWLRMLKDRNVVIRLYDEELVHQLVRRVLDEYLPAFEEFASYLCASGLATLPCGEAKTASPGQASGDAEEDFSCQP